MARPLASKGVSLDRLGSFLAVAEAGGIARAAPGSPVRQSQLSRQIGELERGLGAALFERGTQGPRTPTPAGKALARTVRDFLQGLEDVAKSAEDELPRCRLGAGDSALRWLLLPHARELANKVVLEVSARSSEEIVSELEDATLDLGVVLAATRLPAALKVARLGRVEYALFVPEDSPDAPLAAVSGEPALAGAIASLGPPSLRCETFPQVAAAVRAGFSGVLPVLARAELGDVRALRPAAVERAATSWVLVWRARLDDVRPDLAPARRLLMDRLRRALA